MAIRTTVASGTSWESKVGYSRAVRARNHVFVSGTTATDKSGHIHCEGDAYGQTVYIFNKIRDALEQADASMSDVVRTRMYVVNIKDWGDDRQSARRILWRNSSRIHDGGSQPFDQ